MIRCGLMALQLLPDNAVTGMILFTDGVVGVTNAAVMQTLLQQLRKWAVACSFVQIDTNSDKHGGAFGKVPNLELMQFIAQATSGTFIDQHPRIQEGGSIDAMNFYHQAIFLYDFRFKMKELHRISVSEVPSGLAETALLRHTYGSRVLKTTLFSVVSLRFSEGYMIKSVAINDEQIRVDLILPWKDMVSFEYAVVARWPLSKEEHSVTAEVIVEAPYEFMENILFPKMKFSSIFRSILEQTFFSNLADLNESDKLLAHLDSFHRSSFCSEIPEPLKKGMALFHMISGSDTPVLSSSELRQKTEQFSVFWRPICNLDMTVWRRWLHTHRITLVLAHDLPLANLHVADNNGKFGVVVCRQAVLAIEDALRRWATFTLIDCHSYIKFEYRTSCKPPCLVVRLAFLNEVSATMQRQSILKMKEILLSQRIPLRTVTYVDEQSDCDLFDTIPKLDTHAEPFSAFNSIPACYLINKPIEKILIRHESLPHNLSQMFQYEEVSKNALNSVLIRYLNFRRWCWLLGSNISCYPVGSEGASNILKILVRRRLHRGFHFAYSSNGMVTMVKQYELLTNEMGNVSSLVQYVIFPPIFLRGSKDVTIRSTAGNSMCSEYDTSEVESFENEPDMQLVTEVWLEPYECPLADEYDANITVAQLLDKVSV
ncbi:unnamed protein product [Soboliphyme baturini]|uniref:VWFA domain-containing protein n=1 Tax=Soboliphyme baturini TaxID=241478 RepID=A0A183IPA4_9BILA|nr:unnamed protein product [Soboliphyme baturini]